jgi:hypothetical protein
MKKGIPILLSLLILFFLPALVSADCADLGRYTRWVPEDAHTIIFYMEETPIARIELFDCVIRPSSTILLLKSYICDSDDIMIDNEKCNIITVKVLY